MSLSYKNISLSLFKNLKYYLVKLYFNAANPAKLIKFQGLL